MVNKKTFNGLLSWLKKNKSIIPDLKLRVGGEPGIISGSNIVDDIPIKIHESCIITDNNGKRTSYGKTLMENNVNGFQNKSLTLITIFILVDMKNPDSFYKDYYKVLPTKTNNFPVLWGDDVLGILKGADILYKIYERKQYLISDYKLICHNCPTFKNDFSFEQFINIRLLVGSRNFGIFINGVKTSSMIPLGDSFNHGVKPQLTWGFNNDFFEMRSSNIIESGTEIHDSYGKKCNSILLLTYGFILDDNENNSIVLTLHDAYNTEHVFRLKKDIKSIVDSGLNAHLETYCVGQVNIEEKKKELLNGIMNTLLNGYNIRSNIKNILKKSPIFSPEKIACRFVMGEIEIIKFFIKYSNS